MKQVQQRNPAMDIVRCFACFSVVGVHFFLNSGFYHETVSGWLMYVMTLVRSMTSVCVPLFLILSGYLMNTRRPNWNYYSKLGKTVAVYILCSCFCLLYRYVFLHQPPSFVGAILDILCYTAAPYSWYIEMYLGLFLIIPFLNILYHNVGSKKGKQLLLLVFLAITSLPTVVNIFSLSGLDWWLTPSISKQYTQIIPQWWTGFYPITYYFIGCYLKEHPIKMRLRHCVGLFLGVTLVAGTFAYYRSYGAAFVGGPWISWNSLLVVLQTVLVFTLLSRLNYRWIAPKGCRFLAKLSDWSLGAYLVSWIFDDLFYPILANIQPNVLLRCCYMPVIVLVVFVCSMALSAVINLIYGCIDRLFSAVKTKIQSSKIHQ